MGADEKGGRTCGAKFDEIIVRAQPDSLTPSNYPDAVDKFERSLDSGCESPEVAVIHANETRAKGSARSNSSRCDLDERLHASSRPAQ